MAFDEKTERAKLEMIFEKLPEKTKLLTEGLVCNASFMICELEKLQNQISGSGEVEQYLHGKGQSGNIMSAATKSYLQMQKNYVQTINSLAKLLPEADEYENALSIYDSNENYRQHREDAIKEFHSDPDAEVQEEAEWKEKMKQKIFKDKIAK